MKSENVPCVKESHAKSFVKVIYSNREYKCCSSQTAISCLQTKKDKRLDTQRSWDQDRDKNNATACSSVRDNSVGWLLFEI